MLSTISSIRPRVFIRTPSAAASRQPSPVSRAATTLPPNLPARRDEDDQRRTAARLSPPLTRPICVRMPVNAKKAGRKQHDARGPRASSVELAGERRVVRDDRAEQERAEDGVDADGLGGQRRQQQRRRTRPRSTPCVQLARRLPCSARPARQQRPHHERPSARCSRALSTMVSSAPPTVRLRDADHERQQAPRGDVVDRGAGERDDAERACLCMPRSVRMRASTGNAVTDIDTPRNSAKHGERHVAASSSRG